MASSIRTNSRSSVIGNAALYGGLHVLGGQLILSITGYLYAHARAARGIEVMSWRR